ncbi:MAG: hypothetical protein RLZZ435_3520 [Cyanobacteriota bacterium]|jgi:hypothetical protein
MAIHPTEKILYNSHPAMLRNNPLLFVLASAAILLYGLGLLIFLAWWFEISDKTLIVSDRRVIYKEGFFRHSEIDIPLSQVSTVVIKQGIWQTLFRVGDLCFGGPATSGYEIEVKGFPYPYRIKHLILANRGW